MSKQTQYQQILDHLRRAGKKGATIRDLQAYSNYPWKRLDELQARYFMSDGAPANCGDQLSHTERIERDWREHNGRKIRVYRLRRV